MTLTVTCKRLPTAMRGSSNQNQQRTYQDSYVIKQTDSGSLASDANMIAAAQAVMAGDPLPLYGDNRTFRGTTDLDSYAQEFDWEWPYPSDQPGILHVNVNFMPAQGVNPGKFTETDPLLWPTEYWVEWTEEQVVLDRAYNVDALTAIGRETLTYGKIVNACGIEYTEPLMKTIFYPVLHCQKYYEDPDEIVALNYAYQNTTNNGTFFGATKRSAKYLGTESGRIQKAGNQSFYVGITRIWFKKTKIEPITGTISGGWDRSILNNGWTHFEIKDGNFLTDSDGGKKRFRNKVFDDPRAGDDEQDPTASCGEPLNLSMIGTVLPPETDPFYIDYRDLDEVDYSGIGIGS